MPNNIEIQIGKRPKTRPEIEGLLLRELQARPDCEQAQAIVVVADDHGICHMDGFGFPSGQRERHGV
jgi:hypothetical protein